MGKVLGRSPAQKGEMTGNRRFLLNRQRSFGKILVIGAYEMAKRSRQILTVAIGDESEVTVSIG